jgi:putative transcriptional regulator
VRFSGPTARKTLGASRVCPYIGSAMSIDTTTSLAGQLLIAMPGIGDARFDRTVILLCQHGEEGAMGLVINRIFPGLGFLELLGQLSLTPEAAVQERRVYAGGPVETGRGFVIHSDDYGQTDGARPVAPGVALSANIDVLQAMADGGGPRRALVCLGYAGWSPGQLDSEMARNVWLSAPVTPTLVFGTPIDQKWPEALAALGIDIAMLSQQSGRA